MKEYSLCILYKKKFNKIHHNLFYLLIYLNVFKSNCSNNAYYIIYTI